MNYETHYNKLIERARTRLLECYTERHHIVPRCMGGSDDAENLINLTAREHYVAHQLLVKIYPRNGKLVYAARMMTIGTETHDRSKNRMYSWLKEKFSEEHSQRMTGNNRYKKSKAHRQKQSLSMQGKNTGKQSKEHIRKRCKRVSINGTVYDSQKAASMAFNVSHTTIQFWLRTGRAKRTVNVVF